VTPVLLALSQIAFFKVAEYFSNMTGMLWGTLFLMLISLAAFFLMNAEKRKKRFPVFPYLYVSFCFFPFASVSYPLVLLL